MSDSQSIGSFKKEFFRKLIHASGAFFLLISKDNLFTAIFLLNLFIFLYFFSQFWEKITGKAFFIIGALANSLKRENTKIDFAPPLLALGIIVCLFFFQFQIAACAILQICIGDAAACLLGKKFGKRKIFYSSKKTYLGSAVFLIASFIVQLPFLSAFDSLLLATLGALLESLPLGALDNFIVPVGVALLFQQLFV